MVLSTESERGKRILRRISDVSPGKDSHVQVSKVQVGDQEYIWPISKLCPLKCKDLEGVDKSQYIKEGGGG